jgi:hypothetical protein
VISDNGPCFRGVLFAEAFTGDDPLLRHVRTRVKSPQTNGVIERFFGTLKYEHLFRGPINDAGALAVEVQRFRQIYNTIRPHQSHRRPHPTRRLPCRCVGVRCPMPRSLWLLVSSDQSVSVRKSWTARRAASACGPIQNRWVGESSSTSLAQGIEAAKSSA